MSANTTPIFTGTPRSAWANTGTTSNTDGTGTTGSPVLVFTAGSNGSYVQTVWITQIVTAAATTVRFFINNGSSLGTAGNNTMAYEAGFTNTTISQTAANPVVSFSPNWILPSGYRVYVTIGTGQTTQGLQITMQGGDY